HPPGRPGPGAGGGVRVGVNGQPAPGGPAAHGGSQGGKLSTMGAPVLADANVGAIIGGSVAGLVVVILFVLSISVKIVTEYERVVFFRFGRIRSAAKGPGVITRIPAVDRVVKVNLRVEVIDIPHQAVITSDNVTIQVDAVAYFQVIDPVKAIIGVDSFRFASLRVA